MNESGNGFLGLTLKRDDLVVIDNKISIKIGKVGDGTCKISICAPKQIPINRISFKGEDKNTRVWRREDKP